MKAQAREMMERMRAGDLRALARAVSIVEDQAEGAAELLRLCAAYAGTAVRIGITGPPGAGKSTLVDQMARLLRGQGRSVGIVAVDPSSPFTGGALLGDRIRMQGFTGDAGVYVRSMASRGAMGGLAAGAAAVCSVLEAAGRGMILIETVGVGQDEVEVIRLADVTIVVLVPGMGDEVQSLKAGVMEVADIFVVNKSDREGSDRVEQEVRAMQSLAGTHGDWVPPVVRTVGLSGEGVAELLATMERALVAHKSGGAHRKCFNGAKEYVPENRPTNPSTPVISTEAAQSRDPCIAASAGMSSSSPNTHKQSLWTASQAPVLDHLGVAVRSIASARGFYEALGMAVGVEETVEHEQVRVAMLPVGESRIELLEATAEDSVIGRFVAKRGEGLHHVAVRVRDVDGMFSRLKAEGIRLVSDTVRTGAGGHRYFFVHPASTGGVLVEIVG